MRSVTRNKMCWNSWVAVLALVALVTLGGCGAPEGKLYQTSTLQALIDGVYDGSTTIGQLKQQGDFGIGTFNALDGEMVMLDGTVYQVPVDGKVRLMGNQIQTPFANVTFFRPVLSLSIAEGTNWPAFQKWLDQQLPTLNVPYAIRIEGTFQMIKTRSVPRQFKPYPKLTAVVKKQVVFDFKEVEGTMVGFRFPAYLKGVNTTGYHMHFLNKPRQKGGHLLGFTVKKAYVYIQPLRRFMMDIPADKAFGQADVSTDKSHAIEAVEKLKK